MKTMFEKSSRWMAGVVMATSILSITAAAQAGPISKGSSGKSAAFRPAKKKTAPQVTIKVLQTATGSKVEITLPQPEAAAPKSDRYTGVIIDTRGLAVERSMSPRIRRADGSDVWTGGDAAPDFVIESGIVSYCKSLEEARAHSRAGANPLILRAAERWNNAFRSDPILSEEDAESLLKMAERDGFLKKFNVVFLID